jgi:hypothetical protein
VADVGPTDAPAWLAQAMGLSLFMQQAQASQFMNALSPGPRSNMVPATPKRPYDHLESDDSFDLQEWLSSLDSDPVRGHAKDNFVQYVDAFELERIVTLQDLSTLDAGTLKTSFGMTLGGANRLLQYARDDFSNKRARYI